MSERVRDSLSVKALAARLARSQRYVRARLAVLALPPAALDAVHRGALALDAALALTKVADWPEEVERLVREDRVSDWEIGRARRAKDTRPRPPPWPPRRPSAACACSTRRPRRPAGAPWQTTAVRLRRRPAPA